MRLISKKELDKILKDHALWVKSAGKGGKKADLTNTNLYRVDLSYAYLRYANLRGANLQGAKLSGANLQGANLQDADLEDASLTGANLSSAKLQGTILEKNKDMGGRLVEADNTDFDVYALIIGDMKDSDKDHKKLDESENDFEDDIVKQSQIIKKVCDETAKEIIKKNVSYGGSLFKENPMLKEEDPEKVIKAEIGHKINRLVFGNNCFNENDLEDLKGYIILLEVYKELRNV